MFVLTPHFYDASGKEVQCSGQPIFYARNPVGNSVATVDRLTGVVTVQDGCGAAIVFAFCDGIESAPRLVSSDCNGSEPPVAFTTFAVDPLGLKFVATEGSNPGDQSVYRVMLKSNVDYTVTANRPWLVVSSGTSEDRISVNTSGMGPGTYSGVVFYVDKNDPKNHFEVKVTLVIKSKEQKPPPTDSGCQWYYYVTGYAGTIPAGPFSSQQECEKYRKAEQNLGYAIPPCTCEKH
jgi:hypothetical protein